MRWNDIEFKGKVWCIPRTKNDDPHSAPLTDQAIEILQQRQAANNISEKSPYVFPGDGKAGYLADPKKAWQRVRQNATIKLWQADTYLAALITKARTLQTDAGGINQLYQNNRFHYSSGEAIGGGSGLQWFYGLNVQMIPSDKHLFSDSQTFPRTCQVL